MNVKGLSPGAPGFVVIVHALAQAQAAVAAARAAGQGLILLSSVAAGSQAGAAWWRALIALSGHQGEDILDCGTDGAAALEALRLGQRRLVIEGPFAASLADTAAGLGAAVVGRPAGLDLSLPGAARALAHYFGPVPGPWQ